MTHEARKISIIEDFLKLESAGGILLMLAMLTAMILANTPWSHYYHELIETNVTVAIGKYIVYPSTSCTGSTTV